MNVIYLPEWKLSDLSLNLNILLFEISDNFKWCFANSWLLDAKWKTESKIFQIWQGLSDIPDKYNWTLRWCFLIDFDLCSKRRCCRVTEKHALKFDICIGKGFYLWCQINTTKYTLCNTGLIYTQYHYFQYTYHCIPFSFTLNLCNTLFVIQSLAHALAYHV